jgi:hypothetical protein
MVKGLGSANKRLFERKKPFDLEEYERSIIHKIIDEKNKEERRNNRE